jgi:hypothetical protein
MAHLKLSSPNTGQALNAHSDWGKITRLAAITAAYNLGILLNRILRREDGALETLIT